MITRIEIGGFKSFVGFELDVPPFLALLGPNGGGESNFVDALMAMRDLTLRAVFESSVTGGRGKESLAFLTTAYHPWDVAGKKVASLVTRALPVGGEGVPLFEVRQILETVHAPEHAS